MAKWWETLYESARDYLSDRYLGDKAVENIVKDVGSVYTGYKTYEDQKRANEALERAYKEYTGDKAATYDTISAALALGLSPMAVANTPTKKSEITDFTEVQDVAKGGIISLPNKKRKKYARGPEIEDIEEMDEEIITPFDLKNEEGVPIGPMVERIKELKIKVQDGTITEEEIIELRNLESKAMFQMASGPDDVPEEQEPMPNWFDLMYEEGIPYGEQVKSDPQLVKPPWMTQEEWLNFQYGRNEAARGGIMNLKKGGRPGFESGTDPTKYKFWELVDTEYMDKKSDEKEAAINADMEAGMSWDDIKKKYNLKDFEDISIKETERENTDSGNRVKEIFETIKKKVGSISFAKGGRTGYAFGSNGADPERPPIYLPDPNEDPENMKMASSTQDYADMYMRYAQDMINDGNEPMGIEDFVKIMQELERTGNAQGGRARYDSGTNWIVKKSDVEEEESPIGRGIPGLTREQLNSDQSDTEKFNINDLIITLDNNTIYQGEPIIVQDITTGKWKVMGNDGRVIEFDTIEEAQTYKKQIAPFAKGGRARKANGGIMDLGGLEKDYRFSGGFVPIGEYEKKDDVPARLSKNEFVMTADAVRAAGGGNINQGAQRMYNIMKNLEAQPTAKRRVA